MTKLDSVLKSKDISLLTKVHIVKAMVFPVVMYGYESWAIKKAECRRIDSFELWFWRHSLERQEIKLVSLTGNQPWILVGRTDAKPSVPPDVNRLLIGKDADAGKDWRREEKGTTEDEMVGWPYWHDGHEFEEALGVGEGREPGVLLSMWLQRVGGDWAIQPNQTEQYH